MHSTEDLKQIFLSQLKLTYGGELDLNFMNQLEGEIYNNGFTIEDFKNIQPLHIIILESNRRNLGEDIFHLIAGYYKRDDLENLLFEKDEKGNVLWELLDKRKISVNSEVSELISLIKEDIEIAEKEKQKKLQADWEKNRENTTRNSSQPLPKQAPVIEKKATPTLLNVDKNEKTIREYYTIIEELEKHCKLRHGEDRKKYIQDVEKGINVLSRPLAKLKEQKGYKDGVDYTLLTRMLIKHHNAELHKLQEAKKEEEQEKRKEKAKTIKNAKKEVLIPKSTPKEIEITPIQVEPSPPTFVSPLEHAKTTLKELEPKKSESKLFFTLEKGKTVKDLQGKFNKIDATTPGSRSLLSFGAKHTEEKQKNSSIIANQRS